MVWTEAEDIKKILRRGSNIIQSEVSQKDKDHYSILMHIYEI